MEIQLNSEFDVIVIGTGFIESLVASACSRVGKRVLHLDQNAYYGGSWASFSLSNIQKWVDDVNKKNLEDELIKNNIEDGKLLRLSSPNSVYFNAKYYWHTPEKNKSSQSLPNDLKPPERSYSLLSGTCNILSENSFEFAEAQEDAKSEFLSPNDNLETSKKFEETSVFYRENLEKFNRKFNIDLSPKVIYARGPLVELFISSNTSRYCEFKCITRVLTRNDEIQSNLVPVPCSRSDVFTNDIISLIEKRILMKFLQFCAKYEEREEEWQEYIGQPFGDFLRAQKLSPKLIKFVTSAIALTSELGSTLDGLRNMKLFLSSLGRFGRLPFLFPLYGTGEIPQAFCRLCAVFEGVYMLHRNMDSIVVSSNTENGENVSTATAVISEGQKFLAKNVVAFSGYLNQYICHKIPRKRSLSRAIFLTSRPIFLSEEDKEHYSVIYFPISGDDENLATITAIELASGAAVCPSEIYLIHFICRGEDAEEDFQEIRHHYFSSEVCDENRDSNEKKCIKPAILFSVYFNQIIYNFESEISLELPVNLFLCSGPDDTQDYGGSIDEAKIIFKHIFPDEEFLPRAPEPNEVIFNNSNGESLLPLNN